MSFLSLDTDLCLWKLVFFFSISDWIAVSVLRSVALSTNSVAASVEPMMQQQFFSLSPMAGQENFGANLDVRNSNAMAVTPTTSSMLAALQQETFVSEPHHAHHTHPHHAAAAHHHAHHAAAAAGAAHHVGPSTFHADTFSSLSYMDHAGAGQDSGMPDVHQSGMFDFGADFEVPDISIHPTPSPAGEAESQQQQSAAQSQVEQQQQGQSSQQQQQSQGHSQNTETQQQQSSESEPGKLEATTTTTTTTTAA
jgi:hypothetical protein